MVAQVYKLIHCFRVNILKKKKKYIYSLRHPRSSIFFFFFPTYLYFYSGDKFQIYAKVDLECLCILSGWILLSECLWFIKLFF
jgi:hypothetical protein